MKKYFKISLVSSFVGLLAICPILLVGALLQPTKFNREQVPQWVEIPALLLFIVLIISLTGLIWHERKEFTKNLKDFINS